MDSEKYCIVIKLGLPHIRKKKELHLSERAIFEGTRTECFDKLKDWRKRRRRYINPKKK